MVPDSNDQIPVKNSENSKFTDPLLQLLNATWVGGQDFAGFLFQDLVMITSESPLPTVIFNFFFFFLRSTQKVLNSVRLRMLGVLTECYIRGLFMIILNFKPQI